MTRYSTSRRLTGLAFTLLILALTLLPSPQVAQAAAPGYIYLVDGQEQAVAYDPISLRSGLLLPQELLTTLEVTISTPSWNQVQLNRGSLSALLTFGERTGLVNGHYLSLSSGPLRVGGHLFVPAMILPELGIQVTEDGPFILIDRWPLSEAAVVDESAYAKAMEIATTSTYITMNRSDLLSVKLTRLNADIVHNQVWTSNPAIRGQSLAWLEDHLLIEVSILNQSSSFLTFDASSIYMVDDQGRQYRTSSELLPLLGEMDQPLAPGAAARAVLVLPLPDSDATVLTLYTPVYLGGLATYLVNQ